MTEHRDSPESEPEPLDKPRTTASRRFARMVESPAARRVALPKLVTAIGLLLGSVLLVGFGGSNLVRMVAAWVASQPGYQLPFAEIELIPEPDPWVLRGKARILEQVRTEAGLGKSISLLDLESDALETDFRRYAWVDDVLKIERSYRRLTVRLSYRKPVAVVLLKVDDTHSNAFVIDSKGVPLPPDDMDWAIKGDDRFQLRGSDDPLIVIANVDPVGSPRIGVEWTRSRTGVPVDGRDFMVPKAARLAAFLQGKQRADSAKRHAPRFAQIYVPDEPSEIFMIADLNKNWVQWGKAPGDETPEEMTAEERWTMILDWIDRHGPLKAEELQILQLKRSGAELVTGKARRKGIPGSG